MSNPRVPYAWARRAAVCAANGEGGVTGIQRMTIIKRPWYRVRRFVAQKVLHTNDSPHAIALGAGVATFIAFLPLVGLQTFVALGAAALMRANKAVCLPMVWITNPFTMGPIYYGCYALGRLVVPTSWSGDEAGLDRLVELAGTASPLQAAFWKDMLSVLLGAGMELWVGCTLVGTVLGIVAYVAVRGGVVGYRERRRQRMLRRTLFRASRIGAGTRNVV